MFGGALGILIAITLGPILADILLSNSEIYVSSTPTIQIIFIALILTALLGAIGTIYPALKASRKNPVDAMRQDEIQGFDKLI